MIFNPSSRKGTAKVNHFFEFAKFILKIFCIIGIIFTHPPYFSPFGSIRMGSKTSSQRTVRAVAAGIYDFRRFQRVINVLAVSRCDWMCLGAPPPPITIVGGCKTGGSESHGGSPTRPLAARLVRQAPGLSAPGRAIQVSTKSPFYAIFLDTSPWFLPKWGVLADRYPLLLHQWPFLWTPVGERRGKCSRRSGFRTVYCK